MSGVISPTNLSLFSSPVSVTRPVATQRPVSNVPPRWNTAPFINLEDDYNMIAPIIAGTTSEPSATIEEGEIKPLLFLSMLNSEVFACARARVCIMYASLFFSSRFFISFQNGTIILCIRAVWIKMVMVI